MRNTEYAYPIRLTPEGVCIQGPTGPVLVEPKNGGLQNGGLQASYTGTHLVNGSAQKYADEQLQDLLKHLSQRQSPWSISADGVAHIHNHRQFYIETFNPEIEALDALKLWLGADA